MSERKKTIYCFAPNYGWDNQQLVKNCGALPLVFHKKYGFDAVMVGGKCDEYSNLEKYLHGVRMEFYKDFSIKSKLDYIKENAHKMDYVVLHGYAAEYVDMMFSYKKINPSGKIYMETDANCQSQDRLPWDDYGYKWLLQNCDVIGASCHKIHKLLSRKWSNKVEYIPNGYYNFMNLDMKVDFSKKENIILTVGRIGTEQKNNELLINSFARIHQSFPNWRVVLAGLVRPEFKNFLNDIYMKYPDINLQIEVKGLISNKQTLIELYKKSKIFALTSTFEGGTPNVIAEALHCGCAIITTDIDGALDAVDNNKCGNIIERDDVDRLSNVLSYYCNNNDLLYQYGKHSIEYAYKNMDFEKIMDRLYYLLNL